MLKYHNFDIVCQEVPDEVSLAINITGCPIKCPGCHSKWLQKDKGTELTFKELDALIECYECAITCVCFMGGDGNVSDLFDLASHVRAKYPHLRIAWYSGQETIPNGIKQGIFNYIKIGPYEASKGGLDNVNTNQRFYVIEANGKRTDITSRFWTKGPVAEQENEGNSSKTEDIPSL